MSEAYKAIDNNGISFDPDPRIYIAVEKLLAWTTSNKERGQFISYDTMSIVSEMIRMDKSWQTVFTKYRKRLLNEHGIALVNEQGQGYRLATSKEQVYLVPSQHTRRAMRQHGKAYNVMDKADKRELSPFDLSARTNTMSAAKDSKKKSKRSLKNINAMLKKSAIAT